LPLPFYFDDHDEDQADLNQEQVGMLALIRYANVPAAQLCANLALKSRLARRSPPSSP
jgi:hypothetical protein